MILEEVFIISASFEIAILKLIYHTFGLECPEHVMPLRMLEYSNLSLNVNFPAIEVRTFQNNSPLVSCYGLQNNRPSFILSPGQVSTCYCTFCRLSGYGA